MANANLKPRRPRAEECTRISVVLEQAAPTDALQDNRKRVAFPWMQVTDTMLEFAGSDQASAFSSVSIIVAAGSPLASIATTQLPANR